MDEELAAAKLKARLARLRKEDGSSAAKAPLPLPATPSETRARLLAPRPAPPPLPRAPARNGPHPSRKRKTAPVQPALGPAPRAASANLPFAQGYIDSPIFLPPPTMPAAHHLTWSQSCYSLITYNSKEILAKDRLVAAVPPASIARLPRPNIAWSSTSDDLFRQALAHPNPESTMSAAGSSLKSIMLWCDLNGVPDELRCPWDTTVLCRYVAELGGRYQAKLSRDRISHMRLWQSIHQIPWTADDAAIEPFLAAAKHLAPPAKHKRDPYLTDHLVSSLEHTNPEDPFDVAWSFATSWGHSQAMRAGEFTTESVPKWNPKYNVTAGALSEIWVDGKVKYVVHIPWTKTTKELGADIPVDPLPPQEDGSPHPACPVFWLKQHLRINKPQPLESLFMYTPAEGRRNSARRPLTKPAWMARTNALLVAAGLPPLDGHSIRIGGATQLLLNGIPIKIVQKMGRWASESAFALYWRYASIVISEYTGNMKIRAAPILRSFSGVSRNSSESLALSWELQLRLSSSEPRTDTETVSAPSSQF
ncbi:hypothetical protein P7C70_g2380, partial [Phenoliferia sp. Uapishka_3]